jgi:hypothetical protein
VGTTTITMAPAAAVTTTVIPSGAATSSAPATAPVAPEPTTGTSFTHALLTHCGIEWTHFGDRWWRTGPLDDGHGNPPPGWDNPRQDGTMVMAAPDAAVFTASSGRSLRFPPAAPGEAPPLCD